MADSTAKACVICPLVLMLALAVSPDASSGTFPARLNNFVVELADIDLRDAGAAAQYVVNMDRPGWLHLVLEGEGAVIAEASAGGTKVAIMDCPGEAMLYVEREGPVSIDIFRDRAARPERLTARRVAEVMVYLFQGLDWANPAINITHSWEEMERSILHSANVVISRPRDRYRPFAENWQSGGGKWLRRESIRPLKDKDTEVSGHFANLLAGQIWDGAAVDEIHTNVDIPHVGRWAGGLSDFSRGPEGGGKRIYWWLAGFGGPHSFSGRHLVRRTCGELTQHFKPVEDAAAHGRRAVRSLGRDGAPVYTAQLNVVLEPGREYTLSAYMRSEGAVPGRHTGVFITGFGWDEQYAALRPEVPDSGWARYEAAFVPGPSRTGYYTVRLSSPVEGSVWFDSIQLERGAEATGFTPGSRNKLDNPGFEEGLARWMQGTGEYFPLVEAAVEHGHVFVPEVYLHEKPEEKSALKSIEEPLGYLREAFADYDGLERHILVSLALADFHPIYSANRLPGVNYKTFLEMQMRALALGEGLEDLRGVGLWAAHYASPEALRWLGALIRHYCIEGKSEVLGNDPYISGHLLNAGFEDGLSGWDVSGRVEAVKIEDMPGAGKLSRYTHVPEGRMAVRTTREEGASANIFGQPVRNLEPGRLYFLRMYSAHADYSEREVQAGIRIRGAEILPERRTVDFSDGKWSHSWRMGPPHRDVFWTMHYRVFRALTEEAYLEISDAADGAVYWDFIEIAPFFEGGLF